MKTYYLESLGCAKNLVDSEIFAGILERAGLKQVAEPEDADLVLVNTCSFLEASLQELDLVLCELSEIKQAVPGQKLAVTGCVMNRGLAEFQDLFPEVDQWIGLKDFSALEKWLNLEHRENPGRVTVLGGFHRYLRISDGCGNCCSFCTIPSIRGTLRSVPMEDLVREAESLAADSESPALELIVIAQDTANYGMDIYGRRALPELLEKLHAIPQFRWIRVMYMHPDHFDPAWLPLWNKLPKLLPYFEIPIQHSEDRILTAMNRKLGKQELRELFTSIRSEIPHAVLRTTLISGFPGETDRDADALLRFAQEVPFLHLGVFQFSPDEGTPACEMEAQVPDELAESRQDELLAFQRERMTEMLEQIVGSTVEVLIEDLPDDDEEGLFSGRAWFQAPEIDGLAFVRGEGLAPGQIRRVIIEDVIESDLFGSAIND